jgi:hypothetical protein
MGMKDWSSWPCTFLVTRKSALVRAPTAKLTIIVTMVSADRVVSPTVNRAFGKRVLLAKTKLLKDGNRETRHHGQEVVNFLTTEGVMKPLRQDA